MVSDPRSTPPRSGPAARTPSRSWREVPQGRSFAVRDLLIRIGATADTELSGQSEVWRVRLGSATLTGYGTGTIHCTGGTEPELDFLYEKIASLLR
jgi:hypothetical protein